MTIAYTLAIGALLLGVGLLIMGVSATQEHLTLLGMTLRAPIARGMGIVSVIFSIVTFLVAYGSSLPPHPTERKREANTKSRSHD